MTSLENSSAKLFNEKIKIYKDLLKGLLKKCKIAKSRLDLYHSSLYNLNSVIQSILAKNSDVTSGKPTQKKGLLRQIISVLPFSNSIVGASEAREARKLQEAQNQEQEKRLEEEFEESKSPTDKRMLSFSNSIILPPD